LGKLTGITYDSVALSGYGLFSENVYLTGKITATSGYIGDSSTGWQIDANGFTNVGTTAATRIGIGTGGYANSGQKFWVDGSGQFSLGDALTWDGNSLTVTGTINIASGEIVGPGMNWRGAYASGTTYAVNDGVSYLSASYICTAISTGNLPTVTSYWDLMADQGDTGGQGDQGDEGDQGIQGTQGIQGEEGDDNQDFSWAAETLATLDTSSAIPAGLAMTSNLLGFHGVIAQGATALTSDFSTYMDDSGHFFFQGSSNSLSWDGTALAANDGSSYIGLTTNGDSTALGGMQGFFAGATSTTGANATIAFGSDGKIRGTGVYIRSEGGTTKEWCIEQSRIFGDGADGTIKVRYHSSTGYKMSMDGAAYQVYYDSNGPTSPAYGDKPFQVENGPSDSSILNVAIHLKRDLYLEKLEIDFDEPGGGDIEIQTNGFRLFVRDKIEFIGDDLDSYYRYLHIMNRGEDASDCSAGSNGGVSSGNMSYVNGSDGTGGGRGGASGTLIGGKGGKDGGDGGDGGGVQTVDGELTAVSGTADTYNDGVDGDDWGAGVDTLEGINGKAGGRGGAGQPGSGNAGSGAGGSTSTGASGGSSTNVTTKIQSLDPHLVTTFRDIYSDSDTSKRVAPTVGSGSGGAGGGGGGGYASLYSVSMQGGGGGGGGGSGGSGGTVMVCVRVVEDNSTNGSVFLKFDASGGDAGNGGNGGLRGEYTSGGGGV
jgi:hypothetical protein